MLTGRVFIGVLVLAIFSSEEMSITTEYPFIFRLKNVGFLEKMRQSFTFLIASWSS